MLDICKNIGNGKDYLQQSSRYWHSSFTRHWLWHRSSPSTGSWAVPGRKLSRKQMMRRPLGVDTILTPRQRGARHMSQESRRPTWKTLCWACRRRSQPEPVKNLFWRNKSLSEKLSICWNLGVHIVAVVQHIQCFQVFPPMTRRLGTNKSITITKIQTKTSNNNLYEYGDIYYHLSRDFEGAFPPASQGSLQQGVPLSSPV